MSKIIMVSGGFDPLHVGHVQMILEAARMGGGDKPQSSSWLVNNAMEQLRGSTN